MVKQNACNDINELRAKYNAYQTAGQKFLNFFGCGSKKQSKASNVDFTNINAASGANTTNKESHNVPFDKNQHEANKNMEVFAQNKSHVSNEDKLFDNHVAPISSISHKSIISLDNLPANDEAKGRRMTIKRSVTNEKEDHTVNLKCKDTERRARYTVYGQNSVNPKSISFSII